MKMKYDAKVDAIYIELSKGRYKHTRKISDVILVDEDAKGKVLGIEILDAKNNFTNFNPKNTTLTVQSV